MDDKKSYLKALGKRLSEARKKIGHENVELLAAEIAKSSRTYEKYEQGQSEPPTELLFVLSADYNVNLNWLFTGRGDVFCDSSDLVIGRDAELLAGFRKLPDDRQLDMLAILAINLKRAGR